MTEPTNAKLFAKMARVMGSVRTLEKTGENKFDKYNYVTSDAIATRIGKALAAEGVAFLPSLVNVETSEYTAKSGGSNFRTVVQMQITFACTDSGATYTILWSGEAIDRSDKSISKAAVSAVKYALLKTFLLAGGDEEDADAESPVVDAPQRAQATPASKHTRAPATTPQRASTPATGKPAPVTDEQLEELNALGEVYYQDEWEAKRVKLVEGVTKGAVSEAEKLLAQDAQMLIEGIQKRMVKQLEADLANAEPIPH